MHIASKIRTSARYNVSKSNPKTLIATHGIERDDDEEFFFIFTIIWRYDKFKGVVDAVRY